MQRVSSQISWCELIIFARAAVACWPKEQSVDIVCPHLQLARTTSKAGSDDDDVSAKPSHRDTGSTTLDISFEDAKPVKKRPVFESSKQEESIDVTQSSEKGEGEGGGGDNALLEFSFDEESVAKPRKKRPVLSSTKNPPKRRSKKNEGEGEGEEEKKVEEVEEPPKTKPPAKKVHDNNVFKLN